MPPYRERTCQQDYVRVVQYSGVVEIQNAIRCRTSRLVAVMKEYRISWWEIIHSVVRAIQEHRSIMLHMTDKVEWTDRSGDMQRLQVCNYYRSHPSKQNFMFVCEP